MKTIGIIGCGAMGTSVAQLATAAGMNVVLGNSRGRESLEELARSLGGQAHAATPAEAATAGEFVFVAIPLLAIDSMPVDELAGKVVLDATNYYIGRDGRFPELDSNELSTSEVVQRQLNKSQVVKAFNNIGSKQIMTLARPHGAGDRSALPIAGDNIAAKKKTAQLLDTLGFDAVDIGPLADSWRSEPNTPAYVSPYLGMSPGSIDINEVARLMESSDGTTVDADDMERLVALAIRGKAGGEVPSQA